MKRIIPLVVIVGVVIAAAAWVYRSHSTALPVAAATARTDTIRHYVDERAKTRLPQSYRITMPYAGRIKAIMLEEGDSVTAGQAVAEIVPDDLDIVVAETKAQFDRLTEVHVHVEPIEDRAQ